MIYLATLEATPIQAGNEAMYSYPPLRMLATGDFLVPQYEHGPFLEKPPLTWWILATSYRLFGVSLFAARLPGALAALGTVLVLALWVRRRSGDRAAVAAALVLMYSFKFAAFARTAAADAFLALAVTVAVLVLDRAARSPTARDWSVGAAAGGVLALAFGVKGLIGVVLPLGGVAAGLLLDRSRPIRATRRGLATVTVFLCAVAPWHWAMTERFGPEFWKSFYLRNQLLRGSTDIFMSNPRGALYYAGVLAVSALPWVAFLPAAVVRRKQGIFAGWLLFGIGFLSLLTMKREVYLMPLFPAIAALVGEYVADSRWALRRRWIWGSAAVLAVGGLAVWTRMGPVVSRIAGRAAWLFVAFSLGAFLATTLAAALRTHGQTHVPVALACSLCFAAILLLESRLSRGDPIPEWGARVARLCAGNCETYRVRLAYRSLDYYSRFEWNDSTDPGDALPRRSSDAYVVLATGQESRLPRDETRVEVLDRRSVWDGDWAGAIRHPDRIHLRSLSLVRLRWLGRDSRAASAIGVGLPETY